MKVSVCAATLLVLTAVHHMKLSTARCCGLTCSDLNSTKCGSKWSTFSCDNPICCGVEPRNSQGSLKTNSLALSVSYPTTREDPLLTIQWEYNIVPQNKLKVNVSLDQENKVLCYYLDGGKTSIEVHDLPNPRTKSYSCKGYNVTVQVYLGSHQAGGINSLTKTIFVEDCWSVMGNRSLEVCGVQVPSPPVNISAVLSVNSSSNESTIRVTWDPPLYHNTDIGLYHIVYIPSRSWGLSVEVLPPVTTHSLSSNDDYVKEKNISFKDLAFVEVVAGVDLIDWRCKICCEQKSYGSPLTTYYYSKAVSQVPVVTVSPPQPAASTVAVSSTGVSSVQSSSTPAAPPPSSSESEPSTWLIVGTGVIGGGLALILCAILVVIAVLAVGLHRKPANSDPYFNLAGQLRDEEAATPAEIESVFLVSSTEEDEEMGKKMRYLVHDLADHGIEAVYYEYENTCQDPHSPAALGIAQWVERQFQRCDLVLFACTQNFLKEWRRESVDVLNPVVWSSRHVLDGILPHQDNMSRFGVVLMGEDCIIPPSLKRFQVFSVFDSESDVIHSDQLIRYILETPPYAPPRVLCE